MAVVGFLALLISSEVKEVSDLSHGVTRRPMRTLVAFSAFQEALVRMVLEDGQRWVPDGSTRQLELWGQRVEVVLEDESTKLNLNGLGEDELASLLSSLGAQDPNALAQAILDFADWDNVPRPLGAEDEYYLSLDPPYRPLNRPFRRFEEILLVKGMSYELWSKLVPQVTLWGGGGTPFGPLSSEETRLVLGKNYRVTVKVDGFFLVGVVQYSATSGEVFHVRGLCEYEELGEAGP